MDWINKFDLFLFDFDGLLVDTEGLHFEAYQRLCARYGCNLPWTLDQFFNIAHTSALGIRNEIERLFPQMFGGRSWDALYSEKKSIYQELLQSGNLSLLPGVQPLLEKLAARGKKRCVVTNSTLPQIELVKTHIPVLQTIPYWFTRESYANPKPAPDGYLKALQELKGPQDRVIGFEDSLRGLKSLQQAGVENTVLICMPTHPQLEGFHNPHILMASSFIALNEML